MLSRRDRTAVAGGTGGVGAPAEEATEPGGGGDGGVSFGCAALALVFSRAGPGLGFDSEGLDCSSGFDDSDLVPDLRCWRGDREESLGRFVK